MEKTADAVVIGGVIFGASVAHFLAKFGYGKIVLLEKRRFAAGAAIWTTDAWDVLLGIKLFWRHRMTAGLAHLCVAFL